MDTVTITAHGMTLKIKPDSVQITSAAGIKVTQARTPTPIAPGEFVTVTYSTGMDSDATTDADSDGTASPLLLGRSTATAPALVLHADEKAVTGAWVYTRAEARQSFPDVSMDRSATHVLVLDQFDTKAADCAPMPKSVKIDPATVIDRHLKNSCSGLVLANVVDAASGALQVSDWEDPTQILAALHADQLRAARSAKRRRGTRG
jgi:hypothetical protein